MQTTALNGCNSKQMYHAQSILIIAQHYSTDISHQTCSEAGLLSHFRLTMATVKLEPILLHWHIELPDVHESDNTNEHTQHH